MYLSEELTNVALPISGGLCECDSVVLVEVMMTIRLSTVLS